MKKIVFLVTAALLPATIAHATEPAMRSALNKWEQQMSEFRAATQVARTEEQRAALKMPDGTDMAAEIWRSVNRKTGERMQLVRPSDYERMRGAKDEHKKVPSYEFDEPWAAPAVVWLMNHPQAFAGIYKGRERQVSYYANALLESIERLHYSSPHMAEVCAKLAESQSVRTYELLQKIYTRNQDLTSRANAAMAMCILLSNPTIQAAEGSAAMARSKQLYYLRQAVSISPENAMFGSTTLSEAAIEMAYVLRRLSVGCIPPRLKVIGMDGQPAIFPVTEKANLLFFWSPSEPLGLDIVRKQAQLAEQYPGLVFTPITVHAQQQEWVDALKEQGIVANCFMDDAENSGGKAYRITQLPTAVLIGKDSRILFIGYPGLPLQTALDNLFNQQNSTKGRIIINGQVQDEEEPPVIQPGSQPTTAPSASDEAPALRDMPEDF